MPFDKWTYTIRLLFTVWILDCTSIQIPIALTYLSLHFRPGAPQANSSSSSSVISLKELEESAALKRRQITPLSTITTSTTASMRSAATSPAKPSMLSKSSPQLRRSAGLEFCCFPYEASNLAIVTNRQICPNWGGVFNLSCSIYSITSFTSYFKSI